jgi:hypothetical protein
MKSHLLINSFFAAGLVAIGSSCWAYQSSVSITNNSTDTSYGLKLAPLSGHCGDRLVVKAGQKVSQNCSDSKPSDDMVVQLSAAGSHTVINTCTGYFNTSRPVHVVISGSGKAVSCAASQDGTVGWVASAILNYGPQTFNSSVGISQDGKMIVSNTGALTPGTHDLMTTPIFSTDPMTVVERLYSTDGTFLTECSANLQVFAPSTSVIISIPPAPAGTIPTCSMTSRAF